LPRILLILLQASQSSVWPDQNLVSYTDVLYLSILTIITIITVCVCGARCRNKAYAGVQFISDSKGLLYVPFFFVLARRGWCLSSGRVSADIVGIPVYSCSFMTM
jgi:hypothetical protein